VKKMPDPIHGVNATEALGGVSPGQAGSAQSTVRTQPSSAGTAVDSADVAGVEALLATITRAANTVPPVDQTRVAELRQAINSGVYQANPQQIAKMMMEIEDLLASKGKIG
jgi:negative regulator of flagellin synthesis FlgM